MGSGSEKPARPTSRGLGSGCCPPGSSSHSETRASQWVVGRPRRRSDNWWAGNELLSAWVRARGWRRTGNLG